MCKRAVVALSTFFVTVSGVAWAAPWHDAPQSILPSPEAIRRHNLSRAAQRPCEVPKSIDVNKIKLPAVLP